MGNLAINILIIYEHRWNKGAPRYMSFKKNKISDMRKNLYLSFFLNCIFSVDLFEKFFQIQKGHT